MGKLILKDARLYMGQYDMSGLGRTFDELDNEFERADMTAWDDEVMRGMGNRRSVGISGLSLLLDQATGKSLDASEAEQISNFSILFGEDGAPEVGDLAYSIPGIQLAELLDEQENAIVMTGINLVPEPGQANVNYKYPFGVTLCEATERAATVSLSSVDNGAASTAGWTVFLHVMSSGGDWAIKIEHSTDGSAWSDLTTFTADGSTATSEHKGGSGTVNQYTRATLTRTSGNLTAVIVLCRNK